MSNIDIDYVENYKKIAENQKSPLFVNYRGENQYIWAYSRYGFKHGAYYGSFLGLASAIYYRKISHVPIYALASGIAYAAFHGSSAYFRNEV